MAEASRTLSGSPPVRVMVADDDPDMRARPAATSSSSSRSGRTTSAYLRRSRRDRPAGSDSHFIGVIDAFAVDALGCDTKAQPKFLGI
jgi:hypothetical protein